MFLLSLVAFPYIYNYVVLPVLYYLIVVPLYWIGNYLLVKAPYYVFVVPIKYIGYYIGVGIAKLLEFLAQFGMLKSVVQKGGSTIFKVVSAPFFEFVFKPLKLIFGEDKVEYVIGLILVPFVLVIIAAIISSISKCCKPKDKQKKD